MLDALARHSPKGLGLEIFPSLAEVPLFNEDVETSAPSGVTKLWDSVRAADAVIFATPEYNQSLPGVIKNAVDWLTRDPAGSPLKAKPCAVTGATAGRWGTRIAQHQLKTVLMSCGAKILTTPVLFHSDGLSNEPQQDALSQFMNAVAGDLQLLARSAA